jgi:hypothetical protein
MEATMLRTTILSLIFMIYVSCTSAHAETFLISRGTEHKVATAEVAPE